MIDRFAMLKLGRNSLQYRLRQINDISPRDFQNEFDPWNLSRHGF